MRKLMTACCAAACAASGANAQEPHFAAFDVTQSAPARSHDIAALNLGGANISIAAYGRNARARMNGFERETEEARKHAFAFDRDARPAVVTFEARLEF